MPRMKRTRAQRIAQSYVNALLEAGAPFYDLLQVVVTPFQLTDIPQSASAGTTRASLGAARRITSPRHC